MVRKKQIMIKRPLIIKKRKLEKVSKPSQAEKLAMGSGKMAMIRKTMGNSNQATELLIDIELRLRKMAIRTNKAMAATVISICKLLMMSPSNT